MAWSCEQDVWHHIFIDTGVSINRLSETYHMSWATCYKGVWILYIDSVGNIELIFPMISSEIQKYVAIQL